MNKEEALNILMAEVSDSHNPPENAISVRDLMDAGISERIARAKFAEKIKAGWRVEQYIIGTVKTRFIIPPDEL